MFWRCNLLLVLIRTVISYIAVLFTVRIMGKSELSKLSPVQLVVVFMIAELAAIPIDSPDVSVITGLTAIATLSFLQVSISYLSIKSERFKTFINGKPSVLIAGGRINESALKEERITINELMEQLRIGNVPSITDVDYAVMESNGSLSIIQSSEKRPLTAGDMNIPIQKSVMPLIVVSDGFLYKDNLSAMGYNEKALMKKLKSLGIESLKDVFMVFCDENKQMHVYCRTKNGMVEEVLN